MMGSDIIRKIKRFLPFSYENIFIRLVDKNSSTVLDIGTGDGNLMKQINSRGQYAITGVEGHKPFLEESRKSGVYKKLILSDARKINFAKNSFDIVICSQVLEYLSKKEGNALIEKCKDIARKQVIMAAYIGDCKHVSAQDNPYQTSHSAWFPKDLKRLGFKVYGQGWKSVYTENGYENKKATFLNLIPYLLSYLVSPFVFYNPNIATHMIGTYTID